MELIYWFATEVAVGTDTRPSLWFVIELEVEEGQDERQKGRLRLNGNIG